MSIWHSNAFIMINSSYRNKSYRFASTMDTGHKKFCRFHGFRVQGSGLCWRLRREYIWGDARRPEGRSQMSNARRSYELPLSSYRQPPCGNAIKLSGRTFLAPPRGSSPMGEARRYVANDFLNLIAFPSMGRCPEGADRAPAV